MLDIDLIYRKLQHRYKFDNTTTYYDTNDYIHKLKDLAIYSIKNDNYTILEQITIELKQLIKK